MRAVFYAILNCAVPSLPCVSRVYDLNKQNDRISIIMPNQTSSSHEQSNAISDPRDAAYRYLAKQANRMPDLTISEMNTGVLDVRDSSLAHAIVDQAITRWLTLEFILDTLSGRKLSEQEPRMQAVLLGGASQLLLLDRIPPHAAIDESVEWAKRNIRPKAGGMVNAILRKVARAKGERVEPWAHHLDSIPMADGSALSLNGIELPENGRARLVIASSLPTQLIRKWEKQFNDPTEQALRTLIKPPTIINACFAIDVHEIDHLEPHKVQDHFVFTGRRTELVELLDEYPDLWVQDSASSSVLRELDIDHEPELILDMCAGQGTKTRQLRHQFPDSSIIAADVDSKRLSTLKHVFEHDPKVRVLHVDQLEGLQALKDQQPDLILTDVPCSNTGVLPRRREARYRPMRQQLARIIPIQQEILELASRLLKPGGILQYSTCSIEQEENLDQAQWAVDHLGLKLINSSVKIPQGNPGDHTSEYSDGSFFATLTKEIEN